MKKKIYIAIGILAVFCFILAFSGALGKAFGKSAEIGALSVIAVILLILWLRDR